MSDTSHATLASEGALPTALLRFVHRLREAGIPVSMVETLDAVASVRHVDLGDRSQFKQALGTSLVKRAGDWAAFDSLFDIYFAVQREHPDIGTSLDRSSEVRAGERDAARESPERIDGLQEAPSGDLLRALLKALRSDDPAALRGLAALAVEQFAGINPQRTASERYYLYRVLRQLELFEILRRAVQEGRDDSELRTALADRLIRDEQTRRIEEFRRLIAQEIRRRLVEMRGASHAADVFHDRPIEDVDFLTASPAELRQMRDAIRPLAQKLAARVARRRRLRRHGRLDVRRTMRRSLQSGGVPLDPAFRFPKPSRPDLYLLSDISGSVSEFARFTMSLLYAMKAEFSRIRLFVFVDGIDEVTELMEEEAHWLVPRHLFHRTNVITGDGHSDYGNVLRGFWHRYGHSGLDPRATVIITGDARNNYREPGVEALAEIHDRARKLYWLNPEPRGEWGTTDSIMATYASSCHGVFEARNLRQLADFVYHIA